ncbi:MAG: CDP-alcohol phosphatidyltransferase family protein [Deltaproteobacteria bacterium]|nr:CDP-alcohol phosphatidyltransferase family protein [Deltaproteobacteria bacterium]
MAIETALISAPSRGDNRIFGRYLLERVILACERAGVRRFFIQAPASHRTELECLLGSFRSRSEVTVVDRFEPCLDGIDPESPCISFAGNLVFSKLQLKRVLDNAAQSPNRVFRFSSSDADHGGEIAVGPMRRLLEQGGLRNEPLRRSTGELPFALNGRPEDRDEAELRLARSLRHETASTDALLARWLDRRLSWRISLRLARTRITPNQVTIANTCIGLACALMFAIPSYGWRLLASVLFLASTTIDGIDGELARLQMCESEWGGKLDVITDNVVHVAVFAGIFIGVYRASANPIFLWLMVVQLAGFALAALSTFMAFRIRGPQAEKWIEKVERISGRDFAYLLIGFALIDRLEWFCWGTAFGIYVFALVLIWLTVRRRRVESVE